MKESDRDRYFGRRDTAWRPMASGSHHRRDARTALLSTNAEISPWQRASLLLYSLRLWMMQHLCWCCLSRDSRFHTPATRGQYTRLSSTTDSLSSKLRLVFCCEPPDDGSLDLGDLKKRRARKLRIRLLVIGCVVAVALLAVLTVFTVFGVMGILMMVWDPSRCYSATFNNDWVLQNNMVPAADVSIALDVNNTLSLVWNSTLMQLTIRNSLPTNGPSSLWSSVAGHSFLQGSQGYIRPRLCGGIYCIGDYVGLRSVKQTIDSITNATVSGRLLRSDGSLANLYALSFRAVGSSRVDVSLRMDKRDMTHVWFEFASDPDEHFFGFGEQFTHWDSTGHCMPIYLGEQGIGRGRKPITWLQERVWGGSGGGPETTYSAIPHFITSKMRSFWLQTNGFSVFNTKQTASDGRVLLMTSEDNAIFSVFRGASPLDHIAAYTLAAGARMSPLPKWAYDGILLETSGGTNATKYTWETFVTAGVRVAAIVVRDWNGMRTVNSKGVQMPWWTLEADGLLYPDWFKFVANWTIGRRVIVPLTPYLVDVQSLNKPKFRRNFLTEARMAMCVVRDETEQPYMQMNWESNTMYATIDVSRRECAGWLTGIIRNELMRTLANRTVVGFALEGGETAPYDGHYFTTANDYRAHNSFPESFARWAVQGIQGAGQGQPLVWTRATSPGVASVVPLISMGQQMVWYDEFDGMRSVLNAILSIGLSGFSAVHSDIGGHHAVSYPLPFLTYTREQELLLRWTELSCFSDAVLRTHDGSLGDATGVQFDPLTNPAGMIQLMRMATLHRALAPYREKLMNLSRVTGWPMTRPQWLNFPSDPLSVTLDSQFMVGDALLVAPVLDRHKTAVDVYVPMSRGPWIHLWTGIEYPPGWANIGAPIGQPCVLWSSASADAVTWVSTLCRTTTLIPVEGCTRI